MNTRWTVMVVLVLAVVLADGCSRQSRLGEYYSKEHKYSIIPPASWEQFPGKMTDVRFLCPVGNINVAVNGLSRDTSLEEYALITSNPRHKIFQGYCQISFTDIDLGNAKAKRRVYTHTYNDDEFYAIAYIVVKDRTVYTITGTTTAENFSELEATFDECARTFRVE